MGPGHVRSRDKRKHEVWPALVAKSTSQHHWSQQTHVSFDRMKHSESKIRIGIWIGTQTIRIGDAECRYYKYQTGVKRREPFSKPTISLGHHMVI
jgi:hypothetical protein